MTPTFLQAPLPSSHIQNSSYFPNEVIRGAGQPNMMLSTPNFIHHQSPSVSSNPPLFSANAKQNIPPQLSNIQTSKGSGINHAPVQPTPTSTTKVKREVPEIQWVR